MSWQITTIIASALGIVRDSFSKQITRKILPLTTLFYFYISAIVFSTITSFIVFNSNPFEDKSSIWLARLFGIFFGIGVYGMFESIKINLTKTQVYGSYRNLVSIGLSLIFLGELSIINLKVALGFAALLFSLFLPGLFTKSNSSEKINRSWLFWMIINTIFVGAGLFLVKLFVKEIPPIVVLVNQYIGSLFVISLIILLKKITLKGPPRYIFFSLVNGVITALSLTFLYISIQNGPVSTVTSLENLLRTVFTIPVGLFVFKEAKKFKAVDIISLLIALAGAIALII